MNSKRFNQSFYLQGEYGLVSGPFDLLANNGSQDICIYLRPFEAAAYSLLVPVPVLKNYLRLVSEKHLLSEGERSGVWWETVYRQK